MDKAVERLDLDFREVWDDEFGTWGALCHYLQGGGVASIDDEVKQIRFASLIDLFRNLLDTHAGLLTGDFADLDGKSLKQKKLDFTIAFTEFIVTLAARADLPQNAQGLVAATVVELAFLEAETGRKGTILAGQTACCLAFAWLCLHRCGMLNRVDELATASHELVQRFGLERPLEEMLYGEAVTGSDPLASLEVENLSLLLQIMLRWQGFLLQPEEEQAGTRMELVNDRQVALFIGRHESGNAEWFIQERWELLLAWLALSSSVLGADAGEAAPTARTRTKAIDQAAATLMDRAASAGYCIAQFLTDADNRSGAAVERPRKPGKG